MYEQNLGTTERWLSLIGGIGMLLTTARGGRLDSMDAMYEAELQELHNAEGQLCQLANDLARTMSHPELAFRLQEYATELQARRTDLESLLARINADLQGEADDAMRALIDETEKMWRVCAANVRDAAVTASVQRIMHYKIAGYGAIAAYAKALGRET